jgi:PleD family two-component response regulator
MTNEAPRSGKRTEEPQEGDSSASRADLVLLVDDDPVARLLTASALAERNWRVIEADGGAAALELFADNQPDVVVLDALMPERCSSRASAAAAAGGEHVPILMLTGLDDETSIARAYEAGATDFFVKSTTQWTLLSERLRYMIRASRMREELAESRAKLSKAQRIARLGSWGVGHRCPLGQAFRGMRLLWPVCRSRKTGWPTGSWSRVVKTNARASRCCSAKPWLATAR